MSLPIVVLQPQRHKRVLEGHPWIYSNEIVMDGPTKTLTPGTLVEFYTSNKKFIGKGSFNPHCLIAGRIFTRHHLAEINVEWITKRLQDALHVREKILDHPFYRLVHAEADGLPGLIIDRFGPHLSVQVNTAGMDQLESILIESLQHLFKPESIVLRNDSTSRDMEGLKRETRMAYGNPDPCIEVRENGLTYFANLQEGQKTGWYFDQRDNHALIAKYSRHASKVLDLYCHSGGFSLSAAQSGAKTIVGVDSSSAALALAEKAADYNKLSAQCRFERADVFEDLDKRITAKEKYCVVIADPPAFAKTRKDVGGAARAYRKLARLSSHLVAAKGILYIASCSYNMELDNFIENVAIGLSEASREGRILHTTFAAPDHPIHPHLPESSYLKGLVIALD